MTPAEMAGDFRARLGLGHAPVRDLPALIASGARVDVAVVAMPEGLEGMTRRSAETGALIVSVATSNLPERQRFSLAHELGHILFNDFGDDLGSVHAEGPSETRAHEFARHFLAPLDGVRQLVESMPDAPAEALTSAVVQRFGVSPTPAAIQLMAVNAITLAEKTAMATSAKVLATRHGWAAEREALVADAQRPQPPQHTVAAATRAYADGKLSLRVLARLRMTTDIEALEAELVDAGLVPPADDERPAQDFEAW